MYRQRKTIINTATKLYIVYDQDIKGAGLIHSRQRMDSSKRLDTHIVAHQTNNMCSRRMRQQEQKQKDQMQDSTQKDEPFVT